MSFFTHYFSLRSIHPKKIHAGKKLMKIRPGIGHGCFRLCWIWTGQGVTSHTPPRPPPDTVQTPSRHPSDTIQSPSRHLPNTFQTPSRHPKDTLQTPSRTFQTPYRRMRPFFPVETPSRLLPETLLIPSRHLLETRHNPDTFKTPIGHLQDNY